MLALSGYGISEAQNAVSNATVANGSTTLTLTDRTTITLAGVTGVNS